MGTDMSRREALKTFGLAAVGIGLAAKGMAGEPMVQGVPRKMKVILVNGSPHVKGCTYTALSEVAGALNKNGVETEIFWIGNDIQGGCLACNYCREHGRCVRTDSVNAFVGKAKSADGFVFGSPVHYAGPSGGMQCFMIRSFFSVAGTAVFANKPAASVVSCRRAGSTGALDTMNKFYPINNMPMVPSQYWNMVHGNTPDEVRQDLEGLQIMRLLGGNMAWLLQSLEAGSAAGKAAPVPKDHIRTNFIR